MTLDSPVDEELRVYPSIGMKIGPFVADDMEVQVASGPNDVANGHTIVSYRRRGGENAEVSAKLVQKRRIACRVEYLNVDALTNADAFVEADNAVLEGKSIAMDRSVNRDTDALIFSQSRSSQGIADIEKNNKRKIVSEKPSDAMSKVADEVVRLVPLGLPRGGVRSQDSVVCSLSVEDADVVALRSHMQ